MNDAYKVPIAAGRPRMTWARLLRALLAGLVFDLGCLMINGSQFVFLLPLRILPFVWARRMYEDGIRYTKGAFGNLCSESTSYVFIFSHFPIFLYWSSTVSSLTQSEFTIISFNVPACGAD